MRTTTWTTPEAAAKEIFTTLQTRQLTERHARALGERITDLIQDDGLETWLDADSPLETDDLLDVAARLASLPTLVEVTAAMTLLLRIIPPGKLQEIWRDVTSDAPEAGAQIVEMPAVEDAPTIPLEEGTARALEELSAEEALERAEEARMALAEAEEQDAATGASPDALRRMVQRAAGKRQEELLEDEES